MADLSVGQSGAFDIGRVSQRTFRVVGDNFVTLFIMALVLTALPEAVVALASIPDTGNATPGSAAGSILSFLGGMVLQAAVTHTAIVYLNGGKASLGDSLNVGTKNLLAIIGISFLMGFGIVLGLILLIVPGVIMAIAWSVAVPVRVMEKRDVTECLSRSAELTRGSRWPIFGLYFIYLAGAVIVAVVGGVAFGAVGAVMGDPDAVFASVVFLPIVQAVISMVGASGAAAVYYELRSRKEGVGPQELAAVFD